MLAQALFSNFGGGRELPYADVAALCTPEELERASRWGYAMRLGQRLSGGVAAGLERSRLSRRDGILCLELQQEDADLLGEAVERRLRTVAAELGLRPEITFRAPKRARSAAGKAFDPVLCVEIDVQPLRTVVHRDHAVRADPAQRPGLTPSQRFGAQLRRRRAADQVLQASALQS
jgi:hypothetical protein